MGSGGGGWWWWGELLYSHAASLNLCGFDVLAGDRSCEYGGCIILLMWSDLALVAALTTSLAARKRVWGLPAPSLNLPVGTKANRVALG